MPFMRSPVCAGTSDPSTAFRAGTETDVVARQIRREPSGGAAMVSAALPFCVVGFWLGRGCWMVEAMVVGWLLGEGGIPACRGGK